jgi:hypothetical protein
MNETLQYRILKKLSENANGEFIDVANVEENSVLLKTVIKDLKIRDLISTESYNRRFKTIDGRLSPIPSGKADKCKIKLAGYDYLDNIKKLNVDFKLAEQTLKELPRTKCFAIIGLIIAVAHALMEFIPFIISFYK